MTRSHGKARVSIHYSKTVRGIAGKREAGKGKRNNKTHRPRPSGRGYG